MARARRTPMSEAASAMPAPAAAACGTYAPLSDPPLAYRVTDRTVSWLSVTQVVAAPTSAKARADSKMARAISPPSHPVFRKRKLNAWCISSGLKNRATMSSSAPVSMTAMVSGYSSITARK